MVLKKIIITLSITILIVLAVLILMPKNKTEPVNFKIALQNAPINFDPQILKAFSGKLIDENMFIGLLMPNSSSLEIEKGLANSWEVTNGGKTYTFYLRNDIYWSDGVKITAKEIRKSYLRLIHPDSKSQFAGVVRDLIENGIEFGEKKIDDKTVGIKAPDSLTLEITLSKPSPHFIELLTHAIFLPIPMHIVKKYGEAWTDPKNIVVSGPYKLTSYEGNEITLIKNPKYYDRNKIRIDQITFVVEPDNDKAFNMFNNGEIDLVINVDDQRLDGVKNKKAIYSYGVNRVIFYSFNTTIAPLNNNKVRAALSLSLDREKLVHEVLKNASTPTRRISPTYPNYRYLKPVKLYDLERAKKLLDEAGYKDGANFPTLEVKYPKMETTKKTVGFLKEEWKKNLNIDVKLVELDFNLSIKERMNLNHQIIYVGWTQNYNDPASFLNIFKSDSNLNGSGFKSSELDDLINLSNVEMDESDRKRLLEKVEEIIIEKEFPVIPLFIENYTYLFNNEKFVGWHPNKGLRYIFKDLRPVVSSPLNIPEEE